MKPIQVTLIIINALGFLFMLIDKLKARNHSYRISEATLMVIAIFGGSFGCLFGMLILRHKIKKPKFAIGLPLLFLIHILLLPFLISLTH